MKEWIQVRIERKTRERLRELLESQRELADNGRTEMPESGRPGGGDPSVDWLINLALDRIDAHRERARRASRKKRGKKENDQAELRQLLDTDGIVAVIPETPEELERALSAEVTGIACLKCFNPNMTQWPPFDEKPGKYWCSWCGAQRTASA